MKTNNNINYLYNNDNIKEAIISNNDKNSQTIIISSLLKYI